MTEKEIPPLFFQTLKDIQENIKEVEGVETCTSAGTTLEEQPSCSMEEYCTVVEEFLASTFHQGMVKDSSVFISAHCMEKSTFPCDVRLEQQSCTALCKNSKGGIRSPLGDIKGAAFYKPLRWRRCKSMRITREDGEEGQSHSYLLQKVDSPKEVIRLCSVSMEGFLHSCIQSPLDDVSFLGDIAPRRPLDQQ